MQRSFPSFLGLCIALVLFTAVTSGCRAPSIEANAKPSPPATATENLNRSTTAKAGVIYQAFNMRFRDIKTQLPELQKQGYTYIQVSPPQKSNPSSEW